LVLAKQKKLNTDRKWNVAMLIMLMMFYGILYVYLLIINPYFLYYFIISSIISEMIFKTI
jgi:hypothetical protein